MRAALIPLCLMATACTVSNESFNQLYPAQGVRLVQADIEQGDLAYQGFTTTDLAVNGDSWGMASQEDRASERKDGNAYGVGIEGDVLVVQASSAMYNAGVDFDIDGPNVMNTDLELHDGDARLQGIRGSQLVTAEDIWARDLEGSADLYANGDLDAEIFPAPGDVLRIEANGGDVHLRLPYGLAYDLQVWGDVEHSMVVDDLGLQQVVTGEAYYAGMSGRGDIRVDVYAYGGSVTIDRTW